jgi:hypothetical protein
MIVQGGEVVYQWGDYDKKITSFSIRKSLISALYGIYSSDGVIDVNQTLEQLGIDDSPNPGREIERGRRVNLGALLLLSKTVFQRQGSSPLEAGPADALRPRSLRVPIEPRWTFGVARANESGLSALRADRAVAHVGPACSAMGQIAGSFGGLCALWLGTCGEVARTSKLLG